MSMSRSPCARQIAHLAQNIREIYVGQHTALTSEAWTGQITTEMEKSALFSKKSQLLQSSFLKIRKPKNFRLLIALDCSLRYRIPSALGSSQASQAQTKIENILSYFLMATDAIERGVS